MISPLLYISYSIVISEMTTTAPPLLLENSEGVLLNDELLEKKKLLEYMQGDTLGFKVNKKIVTIAIVVLFFFLGVVMGRMNRSPKLGKKAKRRTNK